MNVLLLIVDDLNTWLLEDPARYTGKVVAPNIQRLAKEGVLFHNAYTASPVCSPSRTAFLSGVAPWKSGVSRNGVQVGDSKVLQGVPSLFRTFQDQGYWIGSFGKVSHGYDTGVKYDATMNHKRTPPPPGAPLNGIAQSAGGKLTERDWGATHLDENDMSDKPNEQSPIRRDENEARGTAASAGRGCRTAPEPSGRSSQFNTPQAKARPDQGQVAAIPVIPFGSHEHANPPERLI